MTASMRPFEGAAHNDPIPHSLLRTGQTGRISEVMGTGEMVHRLREMGLYDGAAVQMIRRGSPCIIKLHGQRLGLRIGDITHVLVRVVDSRVES